MDIVGYINKLQTNVLQLHNDDDFADRLNYRYTVAILVAFAIIVSNRQFSESVIKCWVPAYFTPNYEAYANQVCWISNTFYANQSRPLPKSEVAKKVAEIKYYQWIPFILLIQALFLYIPRILWRMLSTRAGIEMRDLIEAAYSYKSLDKYEFKTKIMKYITDNIDQYVSNPRRLKLNHSLRQKIRFYISSFCFGSGIYLGNYLVTTYFFVKLIYLVNSFGQFFLMNEFLGRQFHELGFDVLQYILTGQSPHGAIESVYFPKVVMCDFRIREYGHPNISQKHTVQCVLPINLYNQQIFTFLWFWFFVLFIANLYALGLWVYRLLPNKRSNYLKKRLKLLKDYRKIIRNDELRVKIGEKTRNFIQFYLKLDGFFIIRMISILASDIVGTEVLYELWKRRQKSDIIDESDEAKIEFESSYSKENENKSKLQVQQNTVLENLTETTFSKSSIIKQPQLVKSIKKGSKSMIIDKSIPSHVKSSLIQNSGNPRDFKFTKQMPAYKRSTLAPIKMQPIEEKELSEEIIEPKYATNLVGYSNMKRVYFASDDVLNKNIPEHESKAFNHKANYPYIDGVHKSVPNKK